MIVLNQWTTSFEISESWLDAHVMSILRDALVKQGWNSVN